MIVGVGVDLCAIADVQRALDGLGEEYTERGFTAAEREYCDRQAGARRAIAYAGRFAGKEAGVKALGVGFGDILWHDVAIHTDQTGRPSVHLTGAALTRLMEITPLGLSPVWHLSLSFDNGIAIAFAVLEARNADVTT